MAGIQLVVELDDKGTPKLRMLDDVLEDLGRQTSRTAGAWTRSFKTMGGAVTGLANRVRSFSTSIPAMLGAAGLTAGLGLMVKRGIEFNAELEASETQLGVMVRDTTRARNMMKELVAFAAKTPFELAETVAAAKALEGAGIGGSEMLRRVGDAAAFAQRPISEMADNMARMASGDFGEAFQNFRRLAIATRPMLEAEGLKFDKGGQYVGSVEDAMAAVSRIIDTRFGGMMETMGGTFRGKMSTLRDSISAALGNVTGPLFERFKDRLDNLIATFDRLGRSQAVRNLGEMLARGFDAAANALDRLAMDPDALANGLARVLQTVGGIIMGLAGLGPAAVKGFRWVVRVVGDGAVLLAAMWGRLTGEMAARVFHLGDKIRNWVVDLVQDIVMSFVAGAASLPPMIGNMITIGGAAVVGELEKMRADVDTAGQRALDEAVGASSGLIAMLKANFNDSLAGPGFWDELMKRIAKARDFARAALPQASANPYAGPQTGPGLDVPRAAAGPTGPTGPDLEIMKLRELHGAWLDISNKRFAANLAAAQQLDKIWTEYWERQDALAMNWLSDSVTAAILEKGQDLKESLDQIWQSMKASFLRNTIDMAIGWVRAKVSMNKADKKFGKEEAAALAAYSAAQVIASKASGKSAAASAAAKYHEAHAWIPFAGVGLASAGVAKMLADIQAAGKGATFRTGTSRVPGAAGAGDVVPAWLEPGEAVIPAARVRQYGTATMDAIRNGSFGGGGGDVFAPVFNLSGTQDAGALRRLMRDEIVPELERLFRQRRLKLA